MTSEEQDEMLQLLRENAPIIKENNELLKKLYRHNVYGFLARLAWFGIIIGFPFALYFYVLGPYFNALGSDYEVFKAGIQEVPGLKNLIRILPGAQ